ncbi:MAG: hypothetical protein LBJ31_10480, partial [Treponema sp.]|nr:hypothetical protein [Treponema sp.]
GVKKQIPAMRLITDGYYVAGETTDLNGTFWLGKINLITTMKKLQIPGESNIILSQIYSFDGEIVKEQKIPYKLYCFERERERFWFLYPDD